MTFGEKAVGTFRRAGSALKALTLLAGATCIAGTARAQEAAAAASAAPAAGSYTPMAPTPGIGMPIDKATGVQAQFSPVGVDGAWMNGTILMPMMIIISLLVLGLLLWVMIRFNSRANPVPSKTSHNTVLEVLWTLIPVLILLVIAVPSFRLLAKQYEPAPEKALTVKVTGNQWYWTYAYPDNGGFEVISNMLNQKGQPVVNPGIREAGSQPWDGPAQLEVDNRLVLPVGEKIKIQATGADVIHAFAVPSLWFKIDAVPGRINERVIEISKPGVYYGQCSELCGARHGYMPIAVEALPRDKFNQWVLTHAGAKIDGQPEPAAAAPKPAAKAPASPAADASAAPSASAAPGA
jgi:cytochrome c oxidase subunit 2